MNSKKLIVFTGITCPDCKRLKEQLEEDGIPYIEKSIEDNEVIADLVMKNIHLQGVPAIMIGDMVFIKY